MESGLGQFVDFQGTKAPADFGCYASGSLPLDGIGARQCAGKEIERGFEEGNFLLPNGLLVEVGCGRCALTAKHLLSLKETFLSGNRSFCQKRVDEIGMEPDDARRMTHAGEFLRNYFKKSGVGQREIALTAGISESHLSKIVKGSLRQIREPALAGLMGALPPGERAGFLGAYFLDITPESYHDLVKPRPSKGRVEEGAPSYPSGGQPSQFESTLQRCFRSPERAKILRMLERIVENAAASPEFLRGIEFFSKLKIKEAE